MTASGPNYTRLKGGLRGLAVCEHDDVNLQLPSCVSDHRTISHRRPEELQGATGVVASSLRQLECEVSFRRSKCSYIATSPIPARWQAQTSPTKCSDLDGQSMGCRFFMSLFSVPETGWSEYEYRKKSFFFGLRQQSVGPTNHHGLSLRRASRTVFARINTCGYVEKSRYIEKYGCGGYVRASPRLAFLFRW
ncbi:hypothetical protein KL921_001082 [Ogataea angusta]|uniref:Uncharacterized protein n=1 Tax=Pichia angusta TaxID=870730 RepID=A0AAN6DIA7_PICAN|nr:uncharacterized protein KL928_001249 [Ogataea angusta]KAG7813536.1 hypothetical protein KL921_001082 [Ogataea angusta]KAG7821165.1 hypothetical protein KL928_001249 [Ogataea angusta]KAG7826133.1 hypothetical protein KL909_000185 [Ogataea angusta]KAG7832120.1 hypothetical protein KL920_000455 [Ogataea angusta]KAG7836293.1 hypothetical protein KL943_001942 [Ogataea angusta]